MLSNEDIRETILSKFSEEIGRLMERNTRIITANAHINAMIKYDLVDFDKLNDYYVDQICESNDLAYIIGLQTGVKLFSELTFGNCALEYMRSKNVYTTDKKSIEIGIDRYYANKNENL